MTGARRRRQAHFMLLASGALAAGAASSQTYPSKPVTVAVGNAAGGTPDILVRTLWATVKTTPFRSLKEVVDTEINKILTIPKFRQQLEEVGGIVRTLTPAEVRQYLRDEHERWGQIIKSSNVRPE